MGQAQESISYGTQKLSLELSATTYETDENNYTTISWVFQSPPPGSIWTGTVSVPNALDTVRFTVVVGGTPWGSFYGSGIFGPVQIHGMEQMVVSATVADASLDPNLLCFFVGSSDNYTNVQPIYPDVQAGTVATRQNNSAEALTFLSTVQGPFTLFSGSPSTVFNATYTLPKNYSAFQVTIIPVNDTYTPFKFELQTLVDNGVTTVKNVQQNTTNYRNVNDVGLAPNFNPITFLVPVTAGPGDLLRFTLSWLRTGIVSDSFKVQVTGYTQSPVTMVQNSPSSALGVMPYGGFVKYVSATGSTGSVQTGPILPTYGLSPSVGSPNGYCYRLHSIRWDRLGTEVFRLFGSSAANPNDSIFAVSGTTNAQPQFHQLGGYLTDCPTLTYSTTVAIPLFQFTLAYDVIQIPPTWIGALGGPL